MSILNFVDFSQVGRLNENDNVLFTSIFTYPNNYAPLDTYIKGIDEFIKMKNKFKLVVFHDDSIPQNVISRWTRVYKIILCKYDLRELYGDNTGLVGTIIRYLPMFTDLFKFNYGAVVDCDRHPGQWKRDFNAVYNGINTETKMNIYNIPLAAELLNRNIASKDKFPLKEWYRISAYPIIIKHGSPLPINILNDFLFETVNTPEYNEVVNYILQYEYEKAHPSQGKFVYGCDEVFLLNVMKYHEDNGVNFIFSVNVYTHRSPFYYWLEYVKPDDAKQLEFLKLVGSKDESVREFLTQYDNTRRHELYDLIKEKFGSNLSFFEDRSVMESINRFIAYNDKDPHALYEKKYLL